MPDLYEFLVQFRFLHSTSLALVRRSRGVKTGPQPAAPLMQPAGRRPPFLQPALRPGVAGRDGSTCWSTSEGSSRIRRPRT